MKHKTIDINSCQTSNIKIHEDHNYYYIKTNLFSYSNMIEYFKIFLALYFTLSKLNLS